MFGNNQQQDSSNNILEILTDRLGKQEKESLDKEDIAGNTPLIYAIKKSWIRLATQLLEQGYFKLNRVDEYTLLSPLHHSSTINDGDFLALVTKVFKKAINAQDFQGNTALHYACWHRNKTFASLLIENGANVNTKNNEGHTALHLACASNNPKFDHSSKLEELLIAQGAEVDALNNDDETPLMTLFKLENEDEIIAPGSKYDPITTLMVFINAKADVNAVSKSSKSPLHYACIRGSTISALTLINSGADCNAKDYSETTPYGYALKNNHEDLCIFLIQQNQLVDIPINTVVLNPDHELNKIQALQSFANSPQVDALFQKKENLEKLHNYQKLDEGYCKLETYSPFYYAIKNNMQGNIYLLIQKGFNKYNALAESIMQNKFNLFHSLLDVIDVDTVKSKSPHTGKNLLHVFAEHANRNHQDIEVVEDFYKLLCDCKVDPNEEDDLGRLPLHYAFKNNNMYVAGKLLDGQTNKQKIDLLSREDNDNITAFAMLFDDMAHNKTVQQPLTQEVLNLVQLDVLKLNPFVRFHKHEFPYTQLAYMMEDQVMIHPLILYHDVLHMNEKEIAECFDLLSVTAKDSDLSCIDQLFLLGRISILEKRHFYETVKIYLDDPDNVKFVESCLCKANNFGAYKNTNRIARFILATFGIKLEYELEVDDEHPYGLVLEATDDHYDYENDSEAYLEKRIPELQAENKSDVECEIDSENPTEKHCRVVQDDDETNFYFDAMMKKVDIKKYYYGLDNFYVIQILKDDVKNLFILWTRWGRSGSIGQFQRTPFGRLEDAVKEFKRVFRQKTGWAWKDIKDYTKTPKKYDIKRLGGKLISKSDTHLKFSNAGFDHKKLMIPLKELDCTVEMVNPIEFKHFLKPLLSDTNVMQSLSASNFSSSVIMLAPQDKPTVDRAIDLLNDLKKLLDKCQKFAQKADFANYEECMTKATDLNSEYLEIIPKVNPTMISALLNAYQVDNEIRMLQSVFTLSYTVRAVLGAYLNQSRINPYDYMLGTMNSSLSVVDPNSEETNLILNYLNQDKLSGFNLRNVIKVDGLDYTDKQDEIFYNTPNHVMLWHGTGAANILSIIKDGLKLAPIDALYHGSRYGNGLYFSDAFALSHCFSLSSDKEKYILLCEVATGKMVNLLSMSNNELTKSDEFDCIRAMPSKGPDWDGSVVKDDVVYPIGRVITYPPPFVCENYQKRFDNLTEFQKHIRNKVRKEKQKVTDKGDYEIIEDESDNEEEMDVDEATNTLNQMTKMQTKGKKKAKDENKLTVLKTSQGETYPLFPNEITAMSAQELKDPNRGMNYWSQNSEYVVYDESLVRVRYIIQLSEKSRSAIAREGNTTTEFTEIRTKRTARISRGGKAPRKHLATKSAYKRAF